jgi:hypothetical protein
MSRPRQVKPIVQQHLRARILRQQAPAIDHTTEWEHEAGTKHDVDEWQASLRGAYNLIIRTEGREKGGIPKRTQTLGGSWRVDMLD